MGILSEAIAVVRELSKWREGQTSQEPFQIHLHQDFSSPGFNLPPVGTTNVFAPSHYVLPTVSPVEFNVEFAPMDEESLDYLDGDQPVVVVVFDPQSPDDAIFAVTELQEGVSGGLLYPGTYGLLAIVYMDDEMEEVDGLGMAEFDVDPGEPSFQLTIPITSDEELVGGLLGSGDAVVIGNVKSRAYHLPDCPGVYRMSVDNGVAFASSTAAEEEGFSPCQQCLG